MANGQIYCPLFHVYKRMGERENERKSETHTWTDRMASSYSITPYYVLRVHFLRTKTVHKEQSTPVELSESKHCLYVHIYIYIYMYASMQVQIWPLIQSRQAIHSKCLSFGCHMPFVCVGVCLIFEWLYHYVTNNLTQLTVWCSVLLSKLQNSLKFLTLSYSIFFLVSTLVHSFTDYNIVYWPIYQQIHFKFDQVTMFNRKANFH